MSASATGRGDECFAIVGLAAVFPGAADAGAFARNLEAGVDAIAEAPASRLDPELAAALPCRRGGFIAPVFDPVGYGIMPLAAAGVEPDQLLALDVAAAALADAGLAGRVADPGRVGVVLGRGGYLTPGVARLANRVRTAHQLAVTLRELVPDLDDAAIERVRAAFAAKSGEVGADVAIGLVPNLAASRIANRLDLRGPAYTVDAACASSLIAVDQACSELASRRCDLVIAGGVHACHDITLWSVFAQLGALSKTAQIRPFDRRADGILIGEGCGVVVLERLADAERAGRRIYAVIRGTGVSSDGREATAMRPRADGQLAALAQAWRDLDPTSVGAVEAHGTATPTGDDVELSALAEHFGAATGPRAVLGSVKSMIGHAMPAAGAAGLIKTALSLHRGVVFPSLHCDEPHPTLARTRFRVLRAAEPWPDDLPRRAGVSAFGFSGTNAHVVVEAHGGPEPRRTPRTKSRESVPTGASGGLLRGRTRRARCAPRCARDTRGGDGAWRLAMLAPTNGLATTRTLADKVIDRGKPWRGKHDLWFTPAPLARTGGTIAFMFPGVEAAFAPDGFAVGEVASRPRRPDPGGDRAERGGRRRDRARARASRSRRGRARPPARGRARARRARAGGVRRPQHGRVDRAGGQRDDPGPRRVGVRRRARSRARSRCPDVVFAAVGCGAEGAQAVLADLDEITVSHDNCPHQSIVCGRPARVALALARFQARGVLCQQLPFRSGFHSRLFSDYLAPHRAHLAGLALQPPRAPVWSATTCAPYPDDADAIRALAIDHLVRPVRFRELVLALYAAGVRAFVQLGVGSLAGFVDDTLRGKDYLAVAAAAAKPGPQLARTLAALWAEGFDPSRPARRGANGPFRHAARDRGVTRAAGMNVHSADAEDDRRPGRSRALRHPACSSACRSFASATRFRHLTTAARPPAPSHRRARRRVGLARRPHRRRADRHPR